MEMINQMAAIQTAGTAVQIGQMLSGLPGGQSMVPATGAAGALANAVPAAVGTTGTTGTTAGTGIVSTGAGLTAGSAGLTIKRFFRA